MKKTIMMAGGALGFSSATELKAFEPSQKIEDEFSREFKKLASLDPFEYSGIETKKQKAQIISPIRTEPKYQNNEPCFCGSGLKYKKCCKSK